LVDDKLARAVRTEAAAVFLLVGSNRGTGVVLVEPPTGPPWLDRAMKAGAW
jgi:hypothetical protein